MNTNKNGDMTKIKRRNVRKLLSVISPLYFLALLVAGIILAFIFK